MDIDTAIRNNKSHICNEALFSLVIIAIYAASVFVSIFMPEPLDTFGITSSGLGRYIIGSLDNSLNNYTKNEIMYSIEVNNKSNKFLILSIIPETISSYPFDSDIIKSDFTIKMCYIDSSIENIYSFVPFEIYGGNYFNKTIKVRVPSCYDHNTDNVIIRFVVTYNRRKILYEYRPYLKYLGVFSIGGYRQNNLSYIMLYGGAADVVDITFYGVVSSEENMSNYKLENKEYEIILHNELFLIKSKSNIFVNKIYLSLKTKLNNLFAIYYDSIRDQDNRIFINYYTVYRDKITVDRFIQYLSYIDMLRLLFFALFLLEFSLINYCNKNNRNSHSAITTGFELVASAHILLLSIIISIDWSLSFSSQIIISNLFNIIFFSITFNFILFVLVYLCFYVSNIKISEKNYDKIPIIAIVFFIIIETVTFLLKPYDVFLSGLLRNVKMYPLSSYSILLILVISTRWFGKIVTRMKKLRTLLDP